MNMTVKFKYPLMIQMIRFAVIAGFFSGHAWADISDDMKKLIEQRRARDAYELGNAHPELFGDNLFDYFYGVAAVDSGRVSLGVLSLERVLLNDPTSDLVRLELARAYFALGELTRAKDEFEIVLKHNPPLAVQSTINSYLDEIKNRESKFKVVYGISAEFGMGYNNNVNTATGSNTIFLPVVGQIILDPSANPKKSVVSFKGIGGFVNIPYSSSLSAFINVGALSQTYSQVTGYNMNNANMSAGLKYIDGSNLWKAYGFGMLSAIDQVPAPNVFGGALEYVRQIGATDTLSLGLTQAGLNYTPEYTAYNSNIYSSTATYRKSFPTTPWKPAVDLGVSFSRQDNQSGRTDLSRNIYGTNIQVSMLPADKWGISVGAGYAASNYDAQDLIYQADRSDGLFSANGLVQYKLSKTLAARVEVNYYQNFSNLNLYSYQQISGMARLKYDWDSK
jgi:tetratricopeptide (TPR) repeat protein